MVRTLLSLLVLGFFAATMVGCHASATVDPHGASQMNLVK